MNNGYALCGAGRRWGVRFVRVRVKIKAGLRSIKVNRIKVRVKVRVKVD